MNSSQNESQPNGGGEGYSADATQFTVVGAAYTERLKSFSGIGHTGMESAAMGLTSEFPGSVGKEIVFGVARRAT